MDYEYIEQRSYELDKNNNFIDITEKLHEYRFGKANSKILNNMIFS